MNNTPVTRRIRRADPLDIYLRKGINKRSRKEKKHSKKNMNESIMKFYDLMHVTVINGRPRKLGRF